LQSRSHLAAAGGFLVLYAPHTSGAFQVLADQPSYLVRSPDRQSTPFPEVLSRYSDVGASQGWLLHLNTELHIENAYYQEGAPKHGIANFIGTEKAVYQVRPDGLRLVSVDSGVPRRPPDQLPVQALIGSSSLHYRYYRYFFQIVFRQRSGERGAVLIGANSMNELDGLASRLMTEPDEVCDGQSPHCAAFPEACTVALEMRIVVNGAERTVVWGSLLDSVTMHPTSLRVLRLYAGKPTPLELDLLDPNALRLPLLPGDRIVWE
jgi:hypothetical protein